MNMSTIELLPYCVSGKSAQLVISEEYSYGLTQKFCMTLSGLVIEHSIQDIHLIINSAGGMSACLEVMLEQLSEFRMQYGTKFTTTALGNAASAAAFTLAFGDLGKRQVLLTSGIHFHLARIKLQGTITARNAYHINQTIQQLDNKIIEQLVEHIAPLFYSSGNHWRFPIKEVVEENFKKFSEEIKSECFYEFKKSLRIRLMEIFEVDLPMHFDTAIAFGLTDRKINFIK